MSIWSDDNCFVAAHPLNNKTGAAAVMADDDVREGRSRFLPVIWDNSAATWYRGTGGPVDIRACGMATLKKDRYLFLGIDGTLLLLDKGQSRIDKIKTMSTLLEDAPLRGITTVGNTVYCYGAGRQVYTQDAQGEWMTLSPYPYESDREYGISSFEDLHGFSDKELYACGLIGDLWYYDGTWHEIESPVTTDLLCLQCTPQGEVYAAGEDGVVIRGRRDRWEVVEKGSIHDDFFSLKFFKGTLFLATQYSLYTFDEYGIGDVDFGADRPESCYKLSVAPDGSCMWSTGLKDLFSFDGKRWTRID